MKTLNELSKATLGSYAKKATKDVAINRKIATDFEHRAKRAKKQDMKDANASISNDFKTKSFKRSANVDKVIDRLVKEEAPKKNQDVADKSYLKTIGKKPTVKSDLKNLKNFLTGKKETMEAVEQIEEVSKSEVDHHFQQWTNSEHAPYNSDAGDDKKVHQSAMSYLKSTNVPKEKHEKLAMHIADKFHGSGIDEEKDPREYDYEGDMARMAINTIGCTGASIVTNEAVKIKRLFFIR